MPEWQIEMLWKCGVCDYLNRGRDKSCQGCGKPLENEEFIMPEDTSYEARVTDAEELKHAKAGPDWKCSYCGSSQRKLDGSCQQCGGGQEEAEPARPIRTEMPPIDLRPNRKLKKILAIVGGVSVAIALLLYFLFRTTERKVVVKSVSWQHTVYVERYRVNHEEGFDENMPKEAFNTKTQGTHLHHHDRVTCGTEQQAYTVSEACGQHCYTTPRTCRRNGNGYASCSGGNRVCSTKYCSRTKYRTVTKYCSVPRYETWYSWDVWRWMPQRKLNKNGTTSETCWPSDSEIALNSSVSGREVERISKKEADYKIVFQDDDGDTYDYETSDPKQFEKLPLGSSHTVLYSIARGVRMPKNF